MLCVLILYLALCAIAINVFKCFHLLYLDVHACVRVILSLFLCVCVCSVEIFSEWAEESMRIFAVACLSTHLTSLTVCVTHKLAYLNTIFITTKSYAMLRDILFIDTVF